MIKIYMKISSNRNLNKAEVYHEKSTKSRSLAAPPESVRAQDATHSVPEMDSVQTTDGSTKETILPTDKQNMLAKRYHNEKPVITFLIVGTGLTACYFW